MNKRNLVRISLIVFIMVLGPMILQWPCSAWGESESIGNKKPERLIEMAAEYTGVEVPLEEDVSMDIIFYNKGKSNEDVDVWIAQKPDGWKARIKTYRYSVSGVHVPADDEKTLTFEAEQGKDIQPGKYEFRVEARTRDDKFKMSQTIYINVKKKEADEKKAKGVKLTTSYPVLQGPSDAKFEFSLEVDSKLEKDAVFDLFAQGPEGWDINFKPAYESKYISSVRLKAGQSSTIAVEVKPSLSAQAGEYAVNIRVTSGNAKAEAPLNVILTGTYGLEVGTPTGLLSLEARQGKPANMSFYVKNTGTATNENIKFMSFKPENWKIAFEPEQIPSIEPGGFKQVEVTLTPNDEALVGDYSVNVRIDGEKASKDIEFRVTVKASSAWGWIGIGIIVLVVVGLTGLFRLLGRR